MKQLILEIPYGGLGDHLFHSHLPRIAKESGMCDVVKISTKSIYRHVDNKKLVWELNPFIDGFVEENGISCDLSYLVRNIKPETNLLDEVMLFFGLDDGKRMHEPEVYYKPEFTANFNKVVYDPNFLSWVGEVGAIDVMRFLKKKSISFDAVMQQRSEKYLYLPKGYEQIICTPTIFDFCNLIYSSKQMYCLTSGTATLASSLGKPAIVFYGKNQEEGYQHSQLHNYVFIKESNFAKFTRRIKSIFAF